MVGTEFDVHKIREDFPVLDQKINGKPLIYFDNAATTQKPKVVIDQLVDYYSGYNANIHRGIHYMAEKATAAYEASRKSLASFVHASSSDEIIFTSGTTEGINLVASTYGRQNVEKGDEIIISGLEHHSNIVPWQMLCEEKGAQLKVIDVTDSGELDMEHFSSLLSSKTKIVSVNHASNTLGTVNPVKEITDLAHNAGAIVVIDGAQAASHLQVDVQAMDCDFYALSAHKMYGPTGVGALYGKAELLNAMPPYKGGGEMIAEVSFDKTTYNELPYKFEAGTPNIGDVIAFKTAIDYVESIGKENILRHEVELMEYATELYTQIEGLRVVGTAKEKVGVVSFVFDDVHHQDIGIMMDTHGIAVRTGHHCTQPLMACYNIKGTSRASFAVYNTKEEIAASFEALQKVVNMLR